MVYPKQGSVLGPLLFNIYLNDLFFQFVNTHPCNFADDTTLSVCNLSLEELLHDLEYDTLSAIIWFENNYMKLNQSKCHFMISGNIKEHMWLRVGNEMIWQVLKNLPISAQKKQTCIIKNSGIVKFI